MSRFIKKILLFFVLVVLIDIISNYGFKYLRAHAKGGDTQKSYYISEKCCDDILILGSSRAARHYDPKVIEDSLGKSCYNCGEPGCGIITAYARYGMIEPRHKPSLVIYEVSPKYDYFISDDYSKYLGRVRQYADKPSVRKMFIELGDRLEGLRLLSSMYRNNSSIVHNVMDNFVKGGGYHGFKPLNGILKADAVQKEKTSSEELLDSLKFSYMEKMIVSLKNENVTICFMVSPKFINPEDAEKESSDYEPIAELCQLYQIPFLNHTYMPGISDNRDLFQDFNHLNQKGAEKYTEAICRELIGYNVTVVE